jgi:hypothetical protein
VALERRERDAALLRRMHVSEQIPGHRSELADPKTGRHRGNTLDLSQPPV